MHFLVFLFLYISAKENILIKPPGIKWLERFLRAKHTLQATYKPDTQMVGKDTYKYMKNNRQCSQELQGLAAEIVGLELDYQTLNKTNRKHGQKSKTSVANQR
ncbi:hypothetical protein U1Q18_052376 [Sarracenia purpurea var. burkii]